uniref:MOSC domain-containing protein n=1 Tax=Heligmosomoides polygyrus TaxID=6339 RepID=A0A8L8KMJ7_HELPZ
LDLSAENVIYVASRLWAYFRFRASDLVPVGIVKELYVYPIKSCKGISVSVFSFYCDKLGPISGENLDRHFIVVDGKTGRFLTGREKPVMVTIECEVREGILCVRSRDGNTVQVDIEKVHKAKAVKTARLQFNLRADGLDCGDEAAVFFSTVLEEPDARLLMYARDLFNERTVVTSPDWWNNNVPKRKEDVKRLIFRCAYANLTPLMIATQASLDDLNSRLEKEVTMAQFRPVIVVEKCPAWDEDKWLDLKIGDTCLQCFKPCQRCLLITVDADTGIKNTNMQPMKMLREFRLAPDGKMREEFKDSPIFGVNAGVDVGYIHVGQTVYARYKKSAF